MSWHDGEHQNSVLIYIFHVFLLTKNIIIIITSRNVMSKGEISYFLFLIIYIIYAFDAEVGNYKFTVLYLLVI